MIDANGNYICDYCQNKLGSGEYFTATGNHVLCQDRARMTARIAQLEAQLAEEVEVIKAMSPKRTGYRESMDWFEYDKAVRRAAEFLKREVTG